MSMFRIWRAFTWVELGRQQSPPLGLGGGTPGENLKSKSEQQKKMGKCMFVFCAFNSFSCLLRLIPKVFLSPLYSDYDLPSSFAAVWCFSDFWAKKEKAFFETTFKKDFLIFLQTVRQRMREKEKKKKMTKTFPIL